MQDSRSDYPPRNTIFSFCFSASFKVSVIFHVAFYVVAVEPWNCSK
jgi:hypothetical protein